MESALSNIRHYQSLGLKNTGASLEEVKRAYKKLSLRYHPDRNSDPSATAKFQEISTAYNVLSTPRKRQVYDAYGEQGLKMYEQYVHMADTDDGGSKIPLQPVTMLLLLCVALSLVILLAAAFGVLLLLYLDGALSSPLAVVLTPLWLIWACGLCCAYALLVSGRANRVYVARLALLLLCLTAFAVLLCVRADAGARLSYALVFLPLYLLEAADVAGAAARCRPAAYEAEKAVGRAQLPYFAHLVRVVGWAGAQLAVVVLLPLRLDGTIAAPWSALLAPGVGDALLRRCRALHAERRQGRRRRRQERERARGGDAAVQHAAARVHARGGGDARAPLPQARRCIGILGLPLHAALRRRRHLLLLLCVLLLHPRPRAEAAGARRPRRRLWADAAVDRARPAPRRRGAHVAARGARPGRIAHVILALSIYNLFKTR